MITQIIKEFKDLSLYGKILVIYSLIAGTFLGYVLYQIIFKGAWKV